MITQEEEIRADNGGVGPVKIVAGNKVDLKELRAVSASKGLEWARERGCGFMETSARECVNVEETFARTSVSSFPPRSLFQHFHQPCWSSLSFHTLHRETRRSLVLSCLVLTRMLLTELPAVIVRRVVAARKLHVEQLAPRPKPSGGLFPASRPQTSRPAMTDKEADVSDFAERPGAKRVKATGFWARFRACWCC